MEGLKIKFKKQWIIPAVSLLLFLSSFSLARAATLFLAPSSGTYNNGSNFNISVRVNSAGVSINAAEGELTFNPNELAVTSLSKSGSIFNLWVQEPDFSNALGTINFGGIIYNPGFTGASGTLLTVNFKAKAVSSTRVTFSSGAVLANDGLGTNILSSLNGGAYVLKATSAVPQLTPAVPQTTPGTASTPVPTPANQLIISSPTHPDKSKWYSNNNPVFKWGLPADANEVILVLSRRANSPPIISYSPPISEKMLTDVGEGIWYLNARARTSAGLGPVTSFRFNVDTQPPRDFSVTNMDTDDLTNPKQELLLESSDATSGIDRYEMKIGDGDWFTISPDLADKPYKLLFKYGTYEIWVKAIDKAGNFIDTNTKIIIKPVPIPKPIIKEVIPSKVKIGEPVIVKGEVIKKVKVKENVVVVVVVIDVLKLENSNSFGQILGPAKDAEVKLIKTVEVPVDENGNFEAKIDGLEPATFILRTYGKDERGAISDAYSDVVIEVAGKSVLTQFTKWVSSAILRGFDSLVNFLSEGWSLIAMGVSIAALVVLIIRRVVPFIADEIRKVRFIASEYKSLKKLKKIDSKTKLEVRMLQKDIKDELNLLKKITSHRPLHTDEQYLKNKLEKYLSLIKNMKG